MITMASSITTNKQSNRKSRRKTENEEVSLVQKIETGKYELRDYEGLVSQETLSEIEALADTLKGLRVIHVNATPQGGGVAEILNSLIPLLRSVGIDAEWHIIPPDNSFSAVTKSLHHYLQGASGHPTDEQMAHYLSRNRKAGLELKKILTADTVCVRHDPQPLPLIDFLPDTAKAVWNCHIDTTKANEFVQDILIPFIRRYHRAIFSREQYVLNGLSPHKVCVFAPAINSLSPKNQALPITTAKHILAQLGIASDRPLITQVSRFDQWKDPWGVIDAYRIARRRIPNLQLALVGTFVAQDDPDSGDVLLSVWKHAKGDPDIHIFSDPNIVADREVNAFQAASDVIIQKSLREGFGLTVAEAMWKGTPVIGGDCGGIVSQIRNGVTGFLVASREDCAARIVTLLQDYDLAKRMGQAGRQSVKHHFLMPRLLKDHLRLYASMCCQSAKVRHFKTEHFGLIRGGEEAL